jgi:hypothetical protein
MDELVRMPTRLPIKRRVLWSAFWLKEEIVKKVCALIGYEKATTRGMHN